MSSSARDPKVDALNSVIVALTPLDNDQQRNVLKTAAEWLGVETTPSHSATPASATKSETRNVAAKAPMDDNQTAKGFLKSKQPLTDVQRVACLAYFLTHMKAQPTFNVRDLRKMNDEAKGHAFSNLSVTLRNATVQNRYFSSLAGGKKQLTGGGEDMVAALPDQDAVKALAKKQRKKRKKNTSKSAAKSKP